MLSFSSDLSVSVDSSTALNVVTSSTTPTSSSNLLIRQFSTSSSKQLIHQTIHVEDEIIQNTLLITNETRNSKDSTNTEEANFGAFNASIAAGKRQDFHKPFINSRTQTNTNTSFSSSVSIQQQNSSSHSDRSKFFSKLIFVSWELPLKKRVELAKKVRKGIKHNKAQHLMTKQMSHGMCCGILFVFDVLMVLCFGSLFV